MSETNYGLPAWVNGLIVFLFTPALLILLGTAFIALLVVMAVLLILNTPFAIWAVLTGSEFKPRFYSFTEENEHEK